MIQGDHGPVAFRNIQYALLDDFNIKLSDVRYEYYEGSFQDFKFTPDALVRKGSAERRPDDRFDASSSFIPA